MKYPCLTCGILVNNASYCMAHQLKPTQQQQQRWLRAKRLKRPHTAAEDKRRIKIVAEWRALHGDLCPGYRRTPHPSSDLTADHIIPYATAGTELVALQVLCRSCNSRKRDQLG